MSRRLAAASNIDKTEIERKYARKQEKLRELSEIFMRESQQPSTRGTVSYYHQKQTFYRMENPPCRNQGIRKPYICKKAKQNFNCETAFCLPHVSEITCPVILNYPDNKYAFPSIHKCFNILKCSLR